MRAVGGHDKKKSLLQLTSGKRKLQMPLKCTTRPTMTTWSQLFVGKKEKKKTPSDSISYTDFHTHKQYQDIRLKNELQKSPYDGDYNQHPNFLSHLHQRAASSGFWATVTDWRFINSTTPHTENVGHKRGAGSHRSTLGQRRANNKRQRVKTHTHTHFNRPRGLKTTSCCGSDGHSSNCCTKNGQKKKRIQIAEEGYR